MEYSIEYYNVLCMYLYVYTGYENLGCKIYNSIFLTLFDSFEHQQPFCAFIASFAHSIFLIVQPLFQSLSGNQILATIKACHLDARNVHCKCRDCSSSSTLTWGPVHWVRQARQSETSDTDYTAMTSMTGRVHWSLRSYFVSIWPQLCRLLREIWGF